MKEGRALGVDSLRKNRLLFIFGLFSFSYRLCKILFTSFLYLNCCKLFEEVFNPRRNKAIVIIIVIYVIIIILFYY